jgi:PAS domain S-box-containing protein
VADNRASVYESVPFAVLVIASDGVVSSANPAAHRMLGYPAGSLRGQRVDGLVMENLDQVYSVFDAGACVRMETRGVKADGRTVHISVTAEPTHKEGGTVSGVALLCRPLPPWHTARGQDRTSSA